MTTEKKKKHDKMVLLAKLSKIVEKTLINSNITHDEFPSVNVLKQYEMKE